MRRDAALLEDIASAAGAISTTCYGLSEGELSADSVRQAAILHHLTVIGEAANRISAALRYRHPEIPWPDIVPQRNRVVHE